MLLRLQRQSERHTGKCWADKLDSKENAGWQMAYLGSLSCMQGCVGLPRRVSQGLCLRLQLVDSCDGLTVLHHLLKRCLVSLDHAPAPPLVHT